MSRLDHSIFGVAILPGQCPLGQSPHYRCAIKAFNRAGGAAMAFSNGFTIDSTPPKAGVVVDGNTRVGEARLHTGLTSVLEPKDALTKRAIALRNAEDMLAEALVPFRDFDGQALPPKDRPRAVASVPRESGAVRVQRRAAAKALAEQQTAASQELAAMVAVIELESGGGKSRRSGAIRGGIGGRKGGVG